MFPSSYDIQQEEDDIFELLDGQAEKHLAPAAEIVQSSIAGNESARSKALQQLAISADSPFNRESSHEINKSREGRATKLREETNLIRKQLDSVKNRLDQLRGQSVSSQFGNEGAEQPDETDSPRTKDASLQPTPAPRLLNRSVGRNLPKFRPLTGKADCPNCTCDRKSSVCSQCMRLDLSADFKRRPASVRRTTPIYNLIDERPIRSITRNLPQSKLISRSQVELVDDKIIPNQVYTISKSLNDKRTKLAQAIDDLQLMIDQLKEKGQRLEQDRKIALLYRDQWKYGPTIGGPKASSREKLGSGSIERRIYESKHDPHLRRDSNSLQGFRHIEPGMRLRQYSITNPKSSPKKLSKLRSKSLESLKENLEDDMKNRVNLESDNFHEGKSSSEANLSSPTLEDVPEVADETLQDISSGPQSVVDCRDPPIEETEQQEIKQVNDEKLTSWIPVFGETEIKTVKRLPKRKVQIISPDFLTSDQPNTDLVNKSRNKNVQQPRTSIKTNTGQPKKPSVPSLGRRKQEVKSIARGGSQVMIDATRKLKMATDLLEQERHDSATKNQLIINKTQYEVFPRQSNLASVQESNNSKATDSSKETLKEIGRLEELVNEQQILLNKLIQTQDQSRTVSPITVQCQSPCCHRIRSNNRVPLGNRSLINNLREKLNKTQLRLARTLELERERHQQLRVKVDSSLRKQSDLENENELLKQSLSKCIDTCLKDISNTFESLSDVLADSVNKYPPLDDEVDGGARSSDKGSSMLTNAAQFISDHRQLKQMKDHIETIENQRKCIFDELSKEKHRSNQLEAQLKQSQAELNKFAEEKRNLELRIHSNKPIPDDDDNLLTSSGDRRTEAKQLEPVGSDETKQSSRSRLTLTDENNETESTYNSVDLYRRYIQSISPDIESIRQERKLILSEFDNIKRILADMNVLD